MHRHDPHLVAPDLHVAFDFGPGVPQPAQETLQRRRFPALIVEREIEKFIERVVSFRSKPPQKKPPRTALSEEPRVKRKRRFALRHPAHLIKPRRCLGKDLLLRRFACQRFSQRRAAAPMSDFKQIVVAETKQRTAQDGRQRQIVLRQQQRLAERNQVHDRNVLGEHKTVGAGDCQFLVLQRTDNGFEQFAALADQDQNVAAARGAGIDQLSDRPRDAARKFDARAGFTHRVERRVPALDDPCGPPA